MPGHFRRRPTRSSFVTPKSKCVLTGVVSLALLSMACPKKAAVKITPPVVRDYHQEAEALFEAGDYSKAAALYEQHLSQPDPKQQAQTLFRLALIHALPDSSLYDPRRATQLFQQLLRLSPAPSLASQSRFILGLKSQISKSGSKLNQHRSEMQDLETEAKQLREGIGRLQSAAIESRAQVEELESDIQRLQDRIRRLQSGIQKREEQIGQLSSELKKLKQIDLGRRPP